MADVVLELPDGDITPLIEHLDGAAFVNLHPGVDAHEVPPRSSLAHLFGNRGPTVPLATWTPGEIGLQHMAGQRAVRYLAERGVAVPDDWYVVSDHPKRGLVLRGRKHNAHGGFLIGGVYRKARSNYFELFQPNCY